MARQAKLMKTNFTANDNITTIPKVLICSEWVSGNYSLIFWFIIYDNITYIDIGFNIGFDTVYIQLLCKTTIVPTSGNSKIHSRKRILFVLIMLWRYTYVWISYHYFVNIHRLCGNQNIGESFMFTGFTGNLYLVNKVV